MNLEDSKELQQNYKQSLLTLDPQSYKESPRTQASTDWISRTDDTASISDSNEGSNGASYGPNKCNLAIFMSIMLLSGAT